MAFFLLFDCACMTFSLGYLSRMSTPPNVSFMIGVGKNTKLGVGIDVNLKMGLMKK